MTRFASDTTVDIGRTRSEIERTLSRYGASSFAYGWEGATAMIGFRVGNRTIRFMLPLPDREEFSTTASGRRRSAVDAQEKAWEQACRSRWRALLLVIKAKLEAVASGISTIEDEFMAWTVLPGGGTVGDKLRQQISDSLETGRVPALMLTGGRA